VLETAARQHRTDDRAAASVELTTSLGLIHRALALEPSAHAETALRQAAVKLEHAVDRLDTAAAANVQDIAGAVGLEAEALHDVGAAKIGPVFPGSVEPLPPRPGAPKASAVGAGHAQSSAAGKNAVDSTIGEINSAVVRGNEAGTLLDRGASVGGYQALAAAVGALEDVQGSAADLAGAGGAMSQVYLALQDDYRVADVLDGRAEGCPACMLEDGYDHELKALGDLGVNVQDTTVHLAPVTSVFDPLNLATKYTAAASDSAPTATLTYTWSLSLELVDPKGAHATGIPGSHAAVDPGCDDAYFPGGKRVPPAPGLGGLSTLVPGFTPPETFVWTIDVPAFTWYHGDPGTYPASRYGCDNEKVGPSGHQGVVTVTVTDGVWSCSSHLDGSDLGLTPARGAAARCRYLPS
jgi:hypothetical protein